MDQRQHDEESVKSKKDESTVTFEEALTRAGFGKFHWILTLGCAMGQFAVVFQLYITSYLLPSIQCDFQINAQQKGLLTSISYIGVILGSYLWGLLADTRGRKNVLVVTLMMDAVFGILSSLAPDFYVFLVLRLLNGFFICCSGAVVFPYFGEFFNSRNRPAAIMIVTIYLPLGLIVLPGIAWLVIPQPWAVELPWCTYNSWRMFVAICSLPSAFGGLMTALVLPESPKFLMVTGQKEATLKVLRHMHALNTGRGDADYKVEHIIPDDENVDSASGKSLLQQLKDMWFEQTLPLFKMPHLPRSLLFFIFEFGVYSCFNSLAMWLPDMFNNMASFTAANGRSGTICEAVSAAISVLQEGNQTVDVAGLNNSGSLDSLTYYSVLADAEVHDNSSTSLAVDVSFSEAESCQVVINPETFTNTLIISTVMVFMTTCLGVAVRWIKQRPIILVFLTVSFASIMGMNYIRDGGIVLVLVCLFFCTCASCASLMLSAAVDLFPTNLRGMAVCLGLMMGRAGVVAGSQIIAALIEYSCPAVFFIEAGTILVCGILAFLLPDRKKEVSIASHSNNNETNVKRIDDSCE